MDPVSAGLWAVKNWKLIVVGLTIAGALGFGTWEHVGRLKAEKALADQKVKTLEDANGAWAEREKKRQAFEKEVRDGLAKLTATQTTALTHNETYQRQVNSNADSSTPLSPADLADLQLLESGSGKAGGNTVRPAGQPANLR